MKWVIIVIILLFVLKDVTKVMQHNIAISVSILENISPWWYENGTYIFFKSLWGTNQFVRDDLINVGT
jgi:hypothetical protein